MTHFRPALYRLTLISATLLLLAACGDTTTATSDGTDRAKPTSAVAADKTTRAATGNSSSLRAYLGDDICDILPASAMKSLFDAPDTVKKEAKAGKSSAKCTYSWPRPDAEERQQAMVQQMIGNAQGKKANLDVRKVTSNFSISVSLAKTKTSAANFVPRKLTEEQMQKKIDEAVEATNKRLTEKQREALGSNGAEKMVSGLIRKSNQRVEVDGVGEAAYWLPMMGGSLSVLANGYKLTISPIMADDEAGNIEAARKIALAILR